MDGKTSPFGCLLGTNTPWIPHFGLAALLPGVLCWEADTGGATCAVTGENSPARTPAWLPKSRLGSHVENIPKHHGPHAAVISPLSAQINTE